MPTRVLAIDDDIAMTELLTLLLRSHGLQVQTANDGNEGIELIKEYKPDIILLDLMMPGMDGWEVCKCIRNFSNTPIVVLSALNNPGMVASALDAGADDYLIKPVPSSILLAHIRNLTRQKKTRELSSRTDLIQNINPAFS